MHALSDINRSNTDRKIQKGAKKTYTKRRSVAHNDIFENLDILDALSLSGTNPSASSILLGK